MSQIRSMCCCSLAHGSCCELVAKILTASRSIHRLLKRSVILLTAPSHKSESLSPAPAVCNLVCDFLSVQIYCRLKKIQIYKNPTCTILQFYTHTSGANRFQQISAVQYCSHPNACPINYTHQTSYG